MSVAKRVGAVVRVLAVAVAGGMLVRRYRCDVRAAQERLAGCDRQVVRTALGDIEYVEVGVGEPLLVSHGIFQGCDGVLLLRDQFPERRVIAPSRFGYLGSSMPAGATPADQADAFVALLDALGITAVDVVGLSAGTTSVLQLALRHPDRVEHLVVLSGNLPDTPTAVVPPSWARLLNRQLPIWAITVFAPTTMAFIAGVPRKLPMTTDDRRYVSEFIKGFLPLTPKLAGVTFDAFLSNADVNSYDLEAISVPTLLVHAKGDPLISYESVERAGRRIPGARLVSLESGGHLMVGQTNKVREELATFFAEPITH